MRRIAAAVLAVALLATGCSNDRYEPKLLGGEVLLRTRSVTDLAIAPNHAIYYALMSGEVMSLQVHPDEMKVAQFATSRLDAIAVSPTGVLYGAYLDGDQITVASWEAGATRSVVQMDSTKPVDIAFVRGRLVVATGDRIVDAQGEIISTGWNAPAIAPGRGSRIWVADNAPGSAKELVARGREKDGPKRRRFATALPAESDPSAIALRENELLVCGRHDVVYRLHVGLDEVARRRGVVDGLRCQNAIVVGPDGSVVTATDDAIIRYGAR